MTDFRAFAERTLPDINTSLENSISESFSDARQELQSAVSYALNAKGKRIRPILCLSVFSLFHNDHTPILPYAVAVEMIHTYSLIHDDLPALDNDDLRRGKPTVHKHFNESTAILAGDALNTLAFEHLASHLPQYFSADTAISAIKILSRNSGQHGMIGGQMLDLDAEDSESDFETLKKIHHLKTGKLIESCFEGPAILAGASSSDRSTLLKFGTSLGLLFQITDDILDVTSDAQTLGKTPNKDIDQNKLTYVSFLGLDGAKKEKDRVFSEALTQLESLQKDTSTLRSIAEFIHSRSL
jgi:geranylgeranyl diphosphate synthase type II